MYKEPEQKTEKRHHRDSSTTRKLKREESKDRRVIVTQEKPSKSKPMVAPVVKHKTPITEKQSSGDKVLKKQSNPTKKVVEREKSIKHESDPLKDKRRESRSNVDALRIKDVLERKVMKKMEAVGKDTRNFKEKEKEKKRKSRDEMEEKSRSRRDRTRTRTLSPTEVKQLIPSKYAYIMSSGDVGKEDQNRESVRCEKEGEEEEEEKESYEEDFEAYESDFEEDEDSVAQDINPPSTYRIEPPEEKVVSEPPPQQPENLEEKWRLEAQKRQLEAIKLSIEKENLELLERRKSTPGSEEDSVKENEKNTSRRKSGQIIDFSKALRRQRKEKKMAASRKRGEELLSMISLDTVTYSILEIPPIPYDEFMKTFGKSNTNQVHVQTNEDDLDEEIQTDDIPLTNKWTQSPPEYLRSHDNGLQVSYVLSKEERLGVGGDYAAEEDEIEIQSRTNGLWNFLSWSSQAMLSVLERKSGNFLNLENMANHSRAVAFGDGFVHLTASDIPFLKGRSVTHLALSSTNPVKLLSVHVNKEKSFQKSMICIWSFRELSKPLRILIASNRVTCCSFDQNQGNLVLAGLSDGSISLWDLREPCAFHNTTPAAPQWTLQSSTFTTAASPRDEGHTAAVVGLRTVGNVDFGFGDFTPTQICSLDRNGTIIIWSVIQLEKVERSAPSEDLGLAHWGRVKLVKSSSFSVFAPLRDEIPGLYITCNDFVINDKEEDGIYVANSLGSVQHCSSYGSLMKPKFYVPTKQDAIVETTCLELCPFNGNYFLVGCGDGSIRLHSRHQETPLICLKSNVTQEEKEAAVVSLTWMRTRPCVFFSLDSMSRINVWDLGVSDMYPELSIALREKKVSCMKLLPVLDPAHNPFIVLGTEGGYIEIHKLKKEYGCRSPVDVQTEMKMFLKYVSIL